MREEELKKRLSILERNNILLSERIAVLEERWMAFGYRIDIDSELLD